MNTRFFPISRHAQEQLSSRWPETVLRPSRFDTIRVPCNARLIGYDSATSAMIVDVPDTPMSAFVAGGQVVTFLTRESAHAKIALHGYGLADFERGADNEQRTQTVPDHRA